MSEQLKQKFSIIFSFEPLENVIDLRFVQSLKAYPSIFSTLAGISIDLIPVREKQPLPIFFSFESPENVTDFKWKHSVNALDSISSTDDGKVIKKNFVDKFLYFYRTTFFKIKYFITLTINLIY